MNTDIVSDTLPYKRTSVDRLLYSLYWFCYALRALSAFFLFCGIGTIFMGKDYGIAIQLGLIFAFGLLAVGMHFLMKYLQYKVFSAANCFQLGTFFSVHNEPFPAIPYCHACRLFDRAIQLCNIMAAAYMNRASCLLSIGPANYDRAEKDIQTAIQQAPDWSRPYYVCGCLAEARKQLDQAIECYTKALSMSEAAISGPPLNLLRDKLDFIVDFQLKHVNPEVIKAAIQRINNNVVVTGVLLHKDKTPVAAHTVSFYPVADNIYKCLQHENGYFFNPTASTESDGRFCIVVSRSRMTKYSEFSIKVSCLKTKDVVLDGKGDALLFKIDNVNITCDVGQVFHECTVN